MPLGGFSTGKLWVIKCGRLARRNGWDHNISCERQNNYGLPWGARLDYCCCCYYYDSIPRLRELSLGYMEFTVTPHSSSACF